MSATLAEAQRMLEAAKKSGKAHMVHFSYRFRPEFRFLAELVASEHLQHQAAEVAEALFADAKQRAPFFPELARMRECSARGARRAGAVGRPLILAAEACKQRRPRHANQGNSEV
jgi:hypothetical protein